jgi:nucleoid-associated protein Lsr2
VMAREVIEKLVDDLDGGDAMETVSFALDGTLFEIDLSKKNAAAFRKLFDRYVKAGRRKSAAGAARRPRRRVARSRSASSTSRSCVSGPARTT